jgi:hypothetical protein
MKKKLKVKKAAIGSAIQARRMVKPGTRPTMGGSPRPGMQLPRPRINVNPNLIYDKPRPGVQPYKPIGPEFGPRDQPLPPMQPSSQIDPNSPRNIIFANPSQTGGGKPFGPPINISSANSTPVGVRGGMGPRPNNFGPMQGVGDPRLGAATIPGNQLQMQMRGPQQAAPVQPVPAMKKGGMVRGQGAAIRGTKFKGIF